MTGSRPGQDAPGRPAALTAGPGKGQGRSPEKDHIFQDDRLGTSTRQAAEAATGLGVTKDPGQGGGPHESEEQRHGGQEGRSRGHPEEKGESEKELNGNEEIFTITVNYDTQKLYGQVKAERQFTVYQE